MAYALSISIGSWDLCLRNKRQQQSTFNLSPKSGCPRARIFSPKRFFMHMGLAAGRTLSIVLTTHYGLTCAKWWPRKSLHVLHVRLISVPRGFSLLFFFFLLSKIVLDSVKYLWLASIIWNQYCALATLATKEHSKKCLRIRLGPFYKYPFIANSLYN